MSNRPDIIFNTLKGLVGREIRADKKRYSNDEVALNTGIILKEMLRYEALARLLLHSEQ